MDKAKIAKVVGIVLVGAAVGFAGSHYAFPTVKEVAGPVQYVDKVIEKTVEVKVPVEVIKEVPVEKIVSVDNGNLGKVMTYIHDNVNEDVTESYILFETDARIEAESYIRDNFKSLLDDGNYFDDGEVFANYRKSEVSIKKIYDATIDSNDYDNNDVTFVYQVKMKAYEDSDHKEDVMFDITVPFEKGKLVDSDVEIQLVE